MNDFFNERKDILSLIIGLFILTIVFFFGFLAHRAIDLRDYTEDIVELNQRVISSTERAEYVEEAAIEEFMELSLQHQKKYLNSVITAWNTQKEIYEEYEDYVEEDFINDFIDTVMVTAPIGPTVSAVMMTDLDGNIYYKDYIPNGYDVYLHELPTPRELKEEELVFGNIQVLNDEDNNINYGEGDRIFYDVVELKSEVGDYYIYALTHEGDRMDYFIESLDEDFLDIVRESTTETSEKLTEFIIPTIENINLLIFIFKIFVSIFGILILYMILKILKELIIDYNVCNVCESLIDEEGKKINKMDKKKDKKIEKRYCVSCFLRKIFGRFKKDE